MNSFYVINSTLQILNMLKSLTDFLNNKKAQFLFFSVFLHNFGRRTEVIEFRLASYED